MTIAVYSDLTGAVGNWLKRDDLTSYIPDLVALGEKRIFDELRVHEMEGAFSVAIASGVVALPADYIEAKVLYLDGSPIVPLIRTDLQHLYTEYPTRSSDAAPAYVARNGTNLEFGPYPDSTYTVKGTYYQKPSVLSASTTTNTIFPIYWDLYLWAALCEAEPFIKNDPRLAVWENKYQQVLARVNGRERKERASGSTIRPRAA
jgi:hypothetical protein